MALPLHRYRDMETQNLSTSEMTLENRSQKSSETSLRKVYLHKRASVLRESFGKNRENVKSFINEIESSTFNATKDELLFAQSLTWMQAHLHTEGNIADLAKSFSVSVRKVQRLFTFFLDRTYTSVLLDMRIEAAKSYLMQQKNSVGEVATLVGIPDHAYFTYLFRKITGVTPTEFRMGLIKQQIS